MWAAFWLRFITGKTALVLAQAYRLAAGLVMESIPAPALVSAWLPALVSAVAAALALL